MLLSFWDGLFSGAFAVSFRECKLRGFVVSRRDRLSVNAELQKKKPTTSSRKAQTVRWCAKVCLIRNGAFTKNLPEALLEDLQAQLLFFLLFIGCDIFYCKIGQKMVLSHSSWGENPPETDGIF